MGVNPSRPFCSERCQLIDLGRWFGEGYALPQEGEEEKGEESDESFEMDSYDSE